MILGALDLVAGYGMIEQGRRLDLRHILAAPQLLSAKKCTEGYVLALVYGPLVNLYLSAQWIAGEFHDRMFLALTRLRRDQSAATFVGAHAGSSNPFDAPFDARSATSFCRYSDAAKVAVVAFRAF